MNQRVLITGMSGLIGSAARKRLEDRYELSALNRRDVPGVPCHRADIANLEAILPAFEGIDTVVHLAALVSDTATWDELLAHNVVGTYNVFEASRRAGVKRIVSASSGAVISGCEAEDPYKALADQRYEDVSPGWKMIDRDTPVRPSGLYGCSKVMGEALARHFADQHGLSIPCLRIGAVTPEDRPLQPRHYSIWCSQGDVAQLIERCIAAPDGLGFDVFYAVSNNRWNYRDIGHARRAVGYEPADNAEDHR